MKNLNTGTYYGHQNSQLIVNGILLSRYDYLSKKTPWHYHTNPYFMFVLEGNMKDTNSRRDTLCPTGSIMYNNWEEAHFGSKHSKIASGFHLEMKRSWLKENNISLLQVEGSQEILNPQLHFLFIQLYREFCFGVSASNLTIEILLFQICDALLEINKIYHNEPAWVNRLKEILHYDSADITLKYLSKELEIHPVHISRMASKYLSSNIGNYRRMIKIKNSVPHLFNGNTNLTQIALLCGFSDQSHFTRVFKEYFKITPSLFRQPLVE